MAQVKIEVGFQRDMLSLLGAMDGVVCAAAGSPSDGGGGSGIEAEGGVSMMVEAVALSPG